MTDLGKPGSGSQALAINFDGDIVGYGESVPGFPPTRALIWHNGVMRDLLPNVPGGNLAVDINDRGDVLGSLTSPENKGFVWNAGTLTLLGRAISNPFGINRAGLVTGFAFVQPDPNRDAFERAVRWRKGSTDTLGTLGGLESWANDINNPGQIVGGSDLANGTSHAYIWLAGVMTDLGTLGGPTSVANAVNVDGWVVGVSDTKFGTTRATLWQPR